MADSICQMLAREGYQPDACHCGHSALERLSQERFDLVLTDLKMDGVDGLELLRHIHESSPEIVVIVMTGHASTESAIEALQNSAFDYLPKPFAPEALLTSVAHAFERIEAHHLRDDMISMISHDIKVPLTSIIGYTSMIRDHRGDGWHPRAEDFLRIINSNANKILSLLDNYLTTCKFEAGRLELQHTSVSIPAVLREIESVVAPEAGKRRLRFRIDCAPDLPLVEADESLLFRVIANLVSNAVKYTPPGSTIDLRARKVSPQESPLGCESLCFIVENPGEGIPAEELPYVFDRFRRTSSSRGAGSGIGLFVVKTVIDAHGGDVRAESQPGELTRMTMHLPLTRAATPA